MKFDIVGIQNKLHEGQTTICVAAGVMPKREGVVTHLYSRLAYSGKKGRRCTVIFYQSHYPLCMLMVNMAHIYTMI